MPARLLAAVMSLVALAGACGGADGEENGGSTTTTVVPVSSTATTEPLPEPTRVEQVLARLLAVRNQVFAAPDANRVGEYAADECPCAEQDRTSLVDLAERVHHWASPQLELRGARVASRPGPDEVALEAVVGRPPERIVNRTGAVIGGQGQGLPNFPARFVLRRRDGNWRLAEVGSLELPPDAVAAIVAAGVPTGPPDDASRL